FSILLHTPTPTLFPYTTLFRSDYIARLLFVAGQFETLDHNVKDVPHAVIRVIDLIGVLKDRLHLAAIFKLLIPGQRGNVVAPVQDRKSTRLNSSHDQISYAVFC